jgi:cleavage and polyadenylation specificity factor subunit 1
MKVFFFTLDSVTQNYPVITAVDNLPYDCLSVHACSPAVGGVIVITSNSIIHVAQTSRRIALPVNGWASRVTDMSLAPIQVGHAARNLALEGCRVAFVNERSFFLFLKDGAIYPVELSMDGATVATISIGDALAQTTPPTVVTVVGEGNLFVGSTSGTSVLLKTTSVEEEVVEEMAGDGAAAAVVDVVDNMIMDDDDGAIHYCCRFCSNILISVIDIYGVSVKPDAPSTVNGHVNGTGHAVKKRSVVHLSLSDSLPGYGPIADMSFALARNGVSCSILFYFCSCWDLIETSQDRVVPELVAATGSGPMSSFTLFQVCHIQFAIAISHTDDLDPQRDLPTRVKRKLHVVGGARGMWSLSLRPTVKVNGTSYERAVNPFKADNDTVIISTDANPTPGLSRVGTLTIEVRELTMLLIVRTSDGEGRCLYHYSSSGNNYWGSSIFPEDRNTACHDKLDKGP